MKIVGVLVLSLFIEPNPAERLPSSKYAYPSHRLRFDIQRPLESVETFRKRINKLETPKGDELPTTTRSKTEWALGANTRDNGSVISDLWHGTAANLAMQKHLAVMPRGGWWKYREKRGRFATLARYSLIISLESEDQTIDLYEPIATHINLLAQIESENVITTVVG